MKLDWKKLLAEIAKVILAALTGFFGGNALFGWSPNVLAWRGFPTPSSHYKTTSCNPIVSYVSVIIQICRSNYIECLGILVRKPKRGQQWHYRNTFLIVLRTAGSDARCFIFACPDPRPSAPNSPRFFFSVGSAPRTPRCVFHGVVLVLRTCGFNVKTSFSGYIIYILYTVSGMLKLGFRYGWREKI